MAKNEVVEKKEYAVALGGDFEQDANNGFDGMGQEDFALPFLKLLTSKDESLMVSRNACFLIDHQFEDEGGDAW